MRTANKNVITDGGRARFNAILRAEENSLSPDDFFDVDSDPQTDVTDTPAPQVVAPVESQPAPLKPGEFILIPSLCEKFNKPIGTVVDMDIFGSLYAGCPVEEYRIRAFMRAKRNQAKQRASLIPTRQRRQAA